MKTTPSLNPFHPAALAVLLLAFCAPAFSDAYRFEMVIFERPDDGSTNEVWPEAPEPADAGKSVGRLDSLAVGGRSLGAIAYTLKKRGMAVHEHIAWYQSPRGRNSQAWYSVGDGRLSGLIRVTRGRFLHVDADLMLRDADSGQIVHAKLYRRMRSGELHYLDHPRLGIVIRADHLRPREKPDAADAAAGEPRPAKPAGSDQPG